MHDSFLRRMVSILLVLTLMLTLFAPCASASISAKVTSSSARAYASVSARARSIKVPKNTKLSITAVLGAWARVSYKGKTAYMKLSCLAPTQHATGYVTKSATVYNSSGKKMGTVSKGTALYVVGTVNNGYCVVNKSGNVGFMKSGTLSKKKPSSVSGAKAHAASSLKGVDKAVALAMCFIGTKYGNGAPQRFNCSSLVYYCMGKAGYSMKGTAAEQAADNRYPLVSSPSKLRRGDLLYFDTNEDGRIDHTAIYLGSNKFIEASQKAGKVQYNTLSSWYKSHLRGARRPG